MPSPGPNETEDEFIQRCMADPEAREDFPDQDQRFAFCQSQWDNREAKIARLRFAARVASLGQRNDE